MTVLAIVPSESVDAAADAVIDPPRKIDPEDKVNAAIGGLLMVTATCLEKFRPELSQPFTKSVCCPLATEIVPSRFAEFTE
jgi:hypothetical protein